jgi:hypothetical protein
VRLSITPAHHTGNAAAASENSRGITDVCALLRSDTRSTPQHEADGQECGHLLDSHSMIR